MKNLTALGKLLTLTAIVTSVGACSTLQHRFPVEQQGGVTATLNSSGTYGGFSIAGKYNVWTLTAEQKRKQTAAVYAALDDDYGVEYKWFEHDAKGIVKAVHGYPYRNGASYCRVIYSYVEVRGRSIHTEETACNNTGQWRFLPKTR